MAVPGHAQGALEFARHYRLPVRAVVQPPAAWFTSHGIPDASPAGDWPAAFAGEQGRYLDTAVPGLDLDGLEPDAGIEAPIRCLEQRGAGQQPPSYRLRDWPLPRHRLWGEPFPPV